MMKLKWRNSNGSGSVKKNKSSSNRTSNKESMQDHISPLKEDSKSNYTVKSNGVNGYKIDLNGEDHDDRMERGGTGSTGFFTLPNSVSTPHGSGSTEQSPLPPSMKTPGRIMVKVTDPTEDGRELSSSLLVVPDEKELELELQLEQEQKLDVPIIEALNSSSHTIRSHSDQSYPTTTSSATTLLKNNHGTASARRVSFHDTTTSSSSCNNGASGASGAFGDAPNGDGFSNLLAVSHKSMAESIASENTRERMGLIHKSSSIRTTNISGRHNVLTTEEFTINKLQFAATGQLFGRDREIELLRTVFNDMAGLTGETKNRKTTTASESASNEKLPRLATLSAHSTGSFKQAVFIGGAPGSGKSVLAMDMTKKLCRRSGGFFMSGKFSSADLYGTGATNIEQAGNSKAVSTARRQQQQQTQPYSGVGDACTDLIADILMIYFDNEVDDMNRSESLYDFVGDSGPLNANHSLGAPASEEIPYNYHRWKFTASQMRSVWAQEKRNLEILSPIVNNIERLWGGGSDGPKCAKDDESMSVMRHSSAFTGSKQAIHYAFARFFTILSEMAPTVILLDDLQWADHASLELFESLMVNEGLHRLLLIGTIRTDAETNAQYPDTNMEAILTKYTQHQRRGNTKKSKNFGMHRIDLEPLTVQYMTLWLQALLDIPADSVTDLAECVHKRTAGNALYVKEFLLSLNHLGLLKYDFGLMKWKYDIQQILTETVAAQNVVTVLTKRIESLPPTDQSILPKIASIGSAFTYHMFQVVVEDTLRKERDAKFESMASSMFNLSNDYSQAKAILDNLECEGILFVDKKHGIIKWAHDKIREAALNLIGTHKGALEQVQFEIGKLLFSQPKQNEIDTSSELYVITNLLNSGAEDVEPGSLKNEIIRLNIRCGETALQSSAYGSATRYFTSGLQLLPHDDEKWDEEYYAMTVSLFAGSAVSHFCVGQHEVVQEMYLQVLKGVRPNTSILTLRRVYDAHVGSLSAQGHTREALDEALKILKVLGCHFPRTGRSARSIGALIDLMTSVDKRTKKIAELPPCEDETIEWIQYLLQRCSVFCYQIDQGLLPLVYHKGLMYTLKHGAAECSGPNLGTIGLLLAGVFGNFLGGKKYGDLALKLTRRNTDASILFIVHEFVFHFLVPFEACKKPLLKGYEAGLRSGDIEAGLWSIYSFLELQLFTSARLAEVQRDYESYCWQMKVHKQDKILCFTRFTFQLSCNLANRGCQRHILTGKIMDETKFEERVKGNPAFMQEWVHYNRNKIYAAFWFGEHERVTDIIEREDFHKLSIEKFNPGVAGTFPMYAHCALSSISMYRKTGAKKHKKRAVIFFKRIKQVVQKGNKNVRHSEALITAEMCTLKHGKGGGNTNPMPHYELAIVLAGRWGLTSDQALAHERVAEYALRIGDMNDARYHYNRAVELYADWGAYGKIEHLQDSIRMIPELAPVASIEFEDSNDNCSSEYSFFSGDSGGSS